MDGKIAAIANRIAERIAAGDFLGAVISLRDAFDRLSEDDYRGLIDRELIRVAGLGSATDWSSVAESVDRAVGLYNLATVYWNVAGREADAVEIMKMAHANDAPDSGLVLAEWLEWLGREQEAMAAIKEYAEQRGTTPKVEGLIGRLSLSVEAIPSAETIARLAIASEQYSEFMPSFWDALIAAGHFERARTSLERAADTGNVDAALRLGNLLSSEFNDKEGAERAYLRAIESGDGHAAHNLAIDLMAAGRRHEARKYLQIAVDRGDADAHEALNGVDC